MKHLFIKIIYCIAIVLTMSNCGFNAIYSDIPEDLKYIQIESKNPYSEFTQALCRKFENTYNIKLLKKFGNNYSGVLPLLIVNDDIKNKYITRFSVDEKSPDHELTMSITANAFFPGKESLIMKSKTSRFIINPRNPAMNRYFEDETHLEEIRADLVDQLANKFLISYKQSKKK